MKTTIKFIDADLVNGVTTLMVGTKLVDITMDEYQMLRRLANDWHNNLEIMSKPNKPTVMKFNSERMPMGQMEGTAQTRIICKILKTEIKES